MSLLKDDRGQFSSAMYFVLIFAVMLFIFAFAIPMLQNQAVHYYAAQEDIVAESLATSEGLTNPTVKSAFQNTLQETQDVQVSNVEILGFAATAGAIIIILIVAGAIFLQGRSLTQQGLVG